MDLGFNMENMLVQQGYTKKGKEQRGKADKESLVLFGIPKKLDLIL